MTLFSKRPHCLRGYASQKVPQFRPGKDVAACGIKNSAKAFVGTRTKFRFVRVAIIGAQSRGGRVRALSGLDFSSVDVTA